MIRIVQASLVILMFTTVNEPASSKSLNADFWLFGEFTQNVPCRGDGSDPAELKARISPDQIEAEAGVCTFLDTRSEADRLKAHALCQFPAGPSWAISHLLRSPTAPLILSIGMAPIPQFSIAVQNRGCSRRIPIGHGSSVVRRHETTHRCATAGKPGKQ
jgi:hypothetical protein